jgi:hypothetical protein
MSQPTEVVGRSRIHAGDSARTMAWLPSTALEIDLADPEQRRFGDYELLARIGEGGMGVVYRARQHGLDRDVAIKLLAAGPAASREFVDRFRREARSAARMQHPNIVEIFEFGHREGLDFFTMRLIEGPNLADRLRSDGPMPPREAARLLRTLAEAVDYAHRLGVLHLDLKPANVLLGATGIPMIADFGLARAIDAEHVAGEVSGTPSYMAPEQALGDSTSAATDLYGLGAILYECLTGAPPFAGGDAQAVLERVVGEAPEAPRAVRRDLPVDLEAICLKCLAKMPVRRYLSARTLADDLGRFLDNRVVTARRPAAWERLRMWARREPRMARLLAVNLALGVAASLVLLVLYLDAEMARREAVSAKKAADEQRALSDQRAERNRQLVGLMASMFAEGSDTAATRAQTASAVAWLSKTLPDDDAAQADVLDALTRALLEGGNRGAAEALLEQIYDQVGDQHLRRLALALAASDDPEHWRLAGLVGQLLPAPDDVAIGDAQLRRAVAARPRDAWTLQVAATACDAHCAVPDAAARLVEVDPGNLYAWVLTAGSSADMQAFLDANRRRGANEFHPRLRALLAGAAKATRWDDGISRMQLELARASGVAGVPVPAALTRPTRAFGAEGGEDRDYAALRGSWTLPMPRLAMLATYCNPSASNPNRHLLDDPALRADCIAVGKVLADGRGLPFAGRVGEVMLRRLLKGTPVEAEMIERRRRYEWLAEHHFGMDARLVPQTEEARLGESARLGELDAIVQRMRRSGLRTEPPPGWQPKDPKSLLLPEDVGQRGGGNASDRIEH